MVEGPGLERCKRGSLGLNCDVTLFERALAILPHSGGGARERHKRGHRLCWTSVTLSGFSSLHSSSMSVMRSHDCAAGLSVTVTLLRLREFLPFFFFFFFFLFLLSSLTWLRSCGVWQDQRALMAFDCDIALLEFLRSSSTWLARAVGTQRNNCSRRVYLDCDNINTLFEFLRRSSFDMLRIHEVFTEELRWMWLAGLTVTLSCFDAPASSSSTGIDNQDVRTAASLTCFPPRFFLLFFLVFFFSFFAPPPPAL